MANKTIIPKLNEAGEVGPDASAAVTTQEEVKAQPAAEPAPEPVAVQDKEQPKASPAPARGRLIPVKGFPIIHPRTLMRFVPTRPSDEVELDDWLLKQIKLGTLKEV